MSASIHQVNALLNRLIEQEFGAVRAHEKPARGTPRSGDEVNISTSARSPQADPTTSLDAHLLALYTQRGRTRP